jgi:pimeloyl-ACP methyl ester carboxylesterase
MRRRTFVSGALASGATLVGRRARLAQAEDVATPASEGEEMTDTVVESGYVDVNGVHMYYERHGSGGVPLVLLHGGLMTIDPYGDLITELARTRQVVAFEVQAHGRTADIDRPLRYEAMADDVGAAIEQLGLGQVDVIGHSLGGGTALQLTIRHPDLVRKLVVVSAPFATAGWHPDILAAVATMNAEVAATMHETPFYQAYVAVAPRPEDWPVLVTKVGGLVSGHDHTYDWTEEVNTITAPTLLIFGDADSVLPEHIEALFQMVGGRVVGDLAPLPSSQLAVLPGTGHSAVLSRTDLLVQFVTSFLDAPMPDAG